MLPLILRRLFIIFLRYAADCFAPRDAVTLFFFYVAYFIYADFLHAFVDCQPAHVFRAEPPRKVLRLRRQRAPALSAVARHTRLTHERRCADAETMPPDMPPRLMLMLRHAARATRMLLSSRLFDTIFSTADFALTVADAIEYTAI